MHTGENSVEPHFSPTSSPTFILPRSLFLSPFPSLSDIYKSTLFHAARTAAEPIIKVQQQQQVELVLKCVMNIVEVHC